MIDQEKWYTLNEIVTNHLVPFSNNYKTIKGYVERGYIKANAISGRGVRKRYYIRGEELQKFLDKCEKGDFKA